MNKKYSIFFLIFFVVHSNAAMIYRKRLKHSRSHFTTRKKIRKKGIFHPFFPQEIDENILKFIASHSVGENLTEAAQIFNAISLTNQFLHRYINNSERTLTYIKDFSQKFNVSNIEVARILCTQESERRYALQKPLDLHPKFDLFHFNILKKQGLDLNFTYNLGKEIKTCLVRETSYCNHSNTKTVNWLIDNGADFNGIVAIPHNIKVLMIMAIHSLDTTTLEKIFNHPNFNINIRNNYNNTLLHLLIEVVRNECTHWRDTSTQRYAITNSIINMLFSRKIHYYGVNTEGMTALDIAEKIPHLHNLLTEAIHLNSK